MKTSSKILLGLPVLGALLLLGGCVVTSVYPYFLPGDVVVEDALVGVWAKPGETNVAEQHWEFSRTEGKAYTLALREGEDTTQFKAHLFKLKQWRFIDAEPVEREGDFIPPHYLLQVHQLGARQFKMSIMDYKWLTALVEEEPSAIAHVWVDRDKSKDESGRLVLTADTAKLQAFVLKYAADTNAFSDPFEMVRQE